MHFEEFLKSALPLSQEAFLREYHSPALIFHSKIENLSSDEMAKTDSFLDHHTITLEPEVSTKKEIDSIEFLKKSSRNPFEALITVGRAANNDIIINKSTISKVHVFFTKSTKTVPRWQISDQKSSNHTYLDGNRLEPEKYYELHDNSIITFGFEVRASFYTPAGLWSYMQIHHPNRFSELFGNIKIDYRLWK